MRIDIETKEFLKAINDFRTASRKKTGSVLKQVGKLGDVSLLDTTHWASGSSRFWPESGVLDRAAEARSLGELEVPGQGEGWPGKRGVALLGGGVLSRLLCSANGPSGGHKVPW